MEPPDSESPSPPHPLIGRTLSGRYTLLALIGSGGMASVFRAHDLRLGRLVALKLLHPTFAADPTFITRFHQEAELAASLSAHPHIVTIYDVGSDGSLHYLVMELVDDGRTLKDLIRAEAPLPVARAFAIGQQIAAALAFAHQRGLVHRDIKPQNILLTTEEQVKVTDFGIARHAAGVQVTRPGVVLGTAAYLAPEQAMGQPAQPASDLYALGVVLFELLTGQLPFQAESTVGLALQQVQEPAPSPRQFNAAIPEAAAAVVLRALAKDPAARYRSAAEFGLALQQGAVPESGQTTTFHPVRQLVPARGWHHAGFTVLAALGAAALAVLSAWLVHGTTSSSHRAVTGPAVSTSAAAAVPRGPIAPVQRATSKPQPTILPASAPVLAPTTPPQPTLIQSASPPPLPIKPAPIAPPPPGPKYKHKPKPGKGVKHHQGPDRKGQGREHKGGEAPGPGGDVENNENGG
jgi:serine/threonine protein kinase